MPTVKPKQVTAKHEFLAEYGNGDLDLDKFTRLAALSCGKAFGLISVLDEIKQYNLSAFGIPAMQNATISRCDSLCDRTATLEAGSFNAISDTTKHPFASQLSSVVGKPYLRWYLGTPLVNDRGRTIGALCVFDTQVADDPTDAQKAILLDIAKCIMNELKLRADCNVALQAKKQFLTSISHEIRNPLHGISTSAELLRLAPDVASPSTNACINEMTHCITALNDIIEHILTLNQSEFGNTLDTSKQNRTSIDIVELAETVIDATWSGCSKRLEDSSQLDILIDIDPQLIGRCFLANSGEISRIILNLFSNAIKFTERGTITIKLAFDDTDQEQLVRLLIEVVDTGCGIAEDLLPHVFEPFTQQQQASTGVGLGLSIVNRLVRNYQGSISVTSEVDHGSTFSAEILLEKSATNMATTVALHKLDDITINLLHDDMPQIKKYCQILGLRTRKDATITITSRLDSHITSPTIIVTKEPLHSLCIVSGSKASYITMPIGPMKLLKAVLHAQSLFTTKRSTQNGLEKLFITDPSTISPIAQPDVIDNNASSNREVLDSSRLSSPTDNTSRRSSTNPQKLHCLVVDDNKMNVRILSTYLTKLGVLCSHAMDGIEAVDLVMNTDDHFDIIFMDINMPRMNGIIASQKIIEHQLKHGRTKSIIAAVSGCSDAEGRYALSCGLDYFFKKPLNLKALAGFITQYENSIVR